MSDALPAISYRLKTAAVEWPLIFMHADSGVPDRTIARASAPSQVLQQGASIPGPPTSRPPRLAELPLLALEGAFLRVDEHFRENAGRAGASEQ
jgi:hypothetical protein